MLPARYALAGALLLAAACGGADSFKPATGPTAVSVKITAPDSLVTGDSAALTAVAYDKDGKPIPDANFVWTSGDTNVAVVDGAGRVVARSYGPVQLVARVAGPLSALASGSEQANSSASIGVRLVLTALSGGAHHNCGIAKGGVVHCWGEGAWGRLGTGVGYPPWKSFTAPVPAATSVRFRSVSGDDYQDSRSGHTCAVTADGAAYCWGSDAWGMLGDGQHGEGIPVTMNGRPTSVTGVPTIKQVALGGSHTCLLGTDETVWCAGANYHGEVGTTSAPNDCTGGEVCVTHFTLVQGGQRFRAITAGVLNTCGLTDTGEAWCWGIDVGGSPVDAFAPQRVPGGLLFQSLSTGGTHNCGITVSGAVYCWGENTFGEAGTGTPTNGAPLATPAAVVTPVPLVSLTSGVYHVCGLSADGTAYCWGDNEYAQLGATTTEQCQTGSGAFLPCSSSPVKVNTNLKFTTIVGGYSHTCGLVASGDAYCWGRNDRGQLGTGDTVSVKTPKKVVSTR